MRKNKFIGSIAVLLLGLSISGCNFVLTGSHTHDWGPWEEIEPATCREKGTKERECSLCDKVGSKSIPVDRVNGHEWIDNPEADYEGTCTTPGISGSKKCTICGTLKRGEEVAKGGHTLVDDPLVGTDRDSTCTAKGLKHQKCANCDFETNTEIPAKGHLDNGTGEKNGKITTVKCGTCGNVLGYDFNITDATGWNQTTKFNAKTGSNAAATWDITGAIPAGSYDVQLDALMTYDSHGERKWYNMAKPSLCIDGVAEESEDTQTPDKITESDFRYTIKVDGAEFTPQSKENWADIGLQGQNTEGTSQLVEFINGITINEGATNISLCHGNIGYSLIIYRIRLISHTHEGKRQTVTGTNGHTTFRVESCSCGYRKVVCNAVDGIGVADANKTDTPEDYLKIKSNGISVSYKFAVPDNMIGNLYMVGREDNYPANATQSPFACEWSNNGTKVEFADSTKKCSAIFGSAADSTFEDGTYSPEVKVLINEVSFAKGSEVEITYKRTGSYNMTLSQVIFEGRAVDHLHNFVRNSAKDTAGTCTTNSKEYYECNCGEFKYVEKLGTTIAHDYQFKVTKQPTCTEAGTSSLECVKCGKVMYSNNPIPASHNMVDATPEEITEYTVSRCTACGLEETTYPLTSELVLDNDGAAYKPTEATPITGGTDSVYAFKTTGRKIAFTYNYTGSADKEATLRILGTTQVSNVSQCKLYKGIVSGGTDEVDRFTVKVNDSVVTIPTDVQNKTMADLGLTSSASAMNDVSALATPAWLNFCTITLKPGNNTIELEVTNEVAYTVYIASIGLVF